MRGGSMSKLLPTAQDVVNLAIGHERFLLKNTGLTNDSSQDHYVFNPQNVLANNRHLKSISQMEGQPNGDATTEGQSLQILGYIYMYRGTKEQYWLDRAIAMFDAYVDHFYQGQPIPDDLRIPVGCVTGSSTVKSRFWLTGRSTSIPRHTLAS